MRIVPLDRITIGPRQRKKMEPAALVDLEQAIANTFLIHPPTYRELVGDDGQPIYQLVAGERRTRAIMKLAEKGISFKCQDQVVAPGFIPILTLPEAISTIMRKQVEFDENKLREPLDWKDEAEALAEIHRLKLEDNVNATRLDTARELIENKTIEATSPEYVAQRIKQATVVAQHLSDPTIANARNVKEAYNLVIKKDEELANAILARRRIAAAPNTAQPITIRKGSCLDILPGLDQGLVDLILTDPPFGIGADKGGFRQRTVHHHNYEDTPENARAIAQMILMEGHRITKPRANIFMFCDIDLFYVLREMAGRVGWVPFRTPIIWQKSHSEGMAPWQAKGFRRTYEMLFWATKGQRGLISSPVDVLDHPRVPRNERIHAAQKPVPLLRRLIECSTLPGDYVLDPCCGSGSTLVAARESLRHGMGIEADETFYNTAMSNVFAPTPTPSQPSPAPVADTGQEPRGGVALESLF